ncbi:hypothetical protein [Trabulsiella odontotermitis]|uniref:Uncharacterized protein n=1 Tax=Trabulsiella odontotermitis TaxID=379893 RepID=A0A0L0GYU3_9ENTR|nr:hypothetical protein [Trabulsiella odontotermitis]KNC93643.1 hypothetical protein GM31_18865 [Trabulsiella odontotermitis]
MENIICSCVNCGKKNNQSDMQWRKIDGYRSRGHGYHCAACMALKTKRAALNTAKRNFMKSAPSGTDFYFSPR